MVAEPAAAEPPVTMGAATRTVGRAPGAIPPMAAFLGAIVVLPRAAVLVWWLAFSAGWYAPPWSAVIGLVGVVLLPLTALVLFITHAGGSLDALDYVVLALALVSDVLTWVAVRFERTYGRKARRDRAHWNDDRETEEACPDRTVPQQWLDLLALALPWPGMRLQATLRRWPAGCTLPRSEIRLLGFLTYDSTARAMYFATPAWIAAIIALAVVNNAAVDWPVRMAVAAIGPMVTIAVIVIVGAQNAQFRVVLPMVKALQVLYSSQSCPPTTLEVRRVNRSIARAADALQRLPVRLHSSHPAVIRDAAEKAAGLGALQEMATSGAEETVQALAPRLRRDLSKILEGQWRKLDGEPATGRIQGLTPLHRAGLVVGAVALFAAAAWVGAGGDRWGPASGAIIAALVGLAMAALIRSGVAPGGLQQAIDLGKDAVALSDAARDSAKNGQFKNSQ